MEFRGLSDYELVELQEQIRKVDQELDVLDPSNVIESQMIEKRVMWLNSVVSNLDCTKKPSSRPAHLQLILSKST